MKCIYALLISFFLTAVSFGQTLTDVLIPQYITAGGTEKTPFAFRVTINGLSSKTIYRCYNRLVQSTDFGTAGLGSGYYIVPNPSGNFTRVTTSTLATAGRYVEFESDVNGSYTGWFISETTTAANLPAGLTLYVRIQINNGMGGSSVVARATCETSPITVINAGTGASDATAIRSTPVTSGTGKNFVMLYDNAAGTGRPIAGTVMENDGGDNLASGGYAAFYANNVNAVDKTWGTIIPNNLPNGIQKIVQYSFADGSKVGSTTKVNGVWPGVGGTTVNTVNPNTGTGTVLVIDGTAAPLSPPASQTITFNGIAPKTYGDADFNPGAFASSNLPVTYTSSDPNVATVINGNTIHIVGAGTVDITAHQAGDDDFGVAPTQQQTLTVNKADLKITANDVSWLVGAPMPTLTVSYATFVNGDNENDLSPLPTITTTANSGSGQGTYPITASNAGSPNYNITYQDGTLTVVPSKQPQTITFAAIPAKVYGTADFSPGASATSNEPVSYASSDLSVATIINNKIHIVKAGTTTITASRGATPTYDPAPDVTQVLTVTKAPLTITVNNQRKLSNQPNPNFTFTYSGFVNGENNTNLLTQPSVNTTAGTNSPAGNYTLKGQGATSDNYAISYVDGILTIDPLAAQTVTFITVMTGKKYGDGDFSVNATASSSLPVVFSSSNTNVATIINNNSVHIVGAGTAQIIASQPGNASYGAAPDISQTLTVQKADLTIRANNYTRNEGESNPAFTVVYTGFVLGEDSSKLAALPVVNTVATAASVAGTYRIDVRNAASPNYFINQQNGILTVLPPQGEAQEYIYAYICAPGQLQLNIYMVNPAKVNNQLFDVNGSRLVNTTTTLVKGHNSYRIPVGLLAPGIYNVRVAGEGVMLKTKVVIR